MADTLIFGTTTITILNGFMLEIGGAAKQVEEVHIPFTDLSFLRNMGLTSALIVASGTETFTTLVDAVTFKNAIVQMEFEEVNIIHERLAPTGIDVECIETNRPFHNTNLFPGFQVEWNATFKAFAP